MTEILADAPEQAARNVGIGRSTLFNAMSKDPQQRRGLPLLASVKVGARRLITREAQRAWLEELGRQQTAQDAT